VRDPADRRRADARHRRRAISFGLGR
jgi:hypothetical protein